MAILGRRDDRTQANPKWEIERGAPTPPGNADGCEKKRVAEKAIRKVLKRKGQ
jgi:hypothetical protein